ncbi:hypothetical protein [Acidithiobacillus sp.]|uniref:hypothetical protein n=1 Tax=Acidithiobacillus sp. TaxID=1872118 RepID=UPI00258D4B41|nr:hypothetical protein [Acidithiobacillus sp.]MDD5374455.1 hypothetical protein [Acidithiobacillus sp.]
MSGPVEAILKWAKDNIAEAESHGCKLVRFILPADFEAYLYSRLMTDRTVLAHEFNVVPTATSGVTDTLLMGVPCTFDKRLPHGKTLFLYDTGTETISVPSEPEPYPGEGPRAA